MIWRAIAASAGPNEVCGSLAMSPMSDDLGARGVEDHERGALRDSMPPGTGSKRSSTGEHELSALLQRDERAQLRGERVGQLLGQALRARESEATARPSRAGRCVARCAWRSHPPPPGTPTPSSHRDRSNANDDLIVERREKCSLIRDLIGPAERVAHSQVVRGENHEPSRRKARRARADARACGPAHPRAPD